MKSKAILHLLLMVILLPFALAKADLSACFPEFRFGTPKKEFLAAYEEKGIEFIQYLASSNDTLTTQNKALNFWGYDADIQVSFTKVLQADFTYERNLMSIQMNFIMGYDEVQHTEAFYKDCADMFLNIACNLESFLGEMTDGRFKVNGSGYNYPDDVPEAFAHAALSWDECEFELSNGNVVLSLSKRKRVDSEGSSVSLIVYSSETYYDSLYNLDDFEGFYGDYSYK